MSESSCASTSSGLMSGSVFATGIVPPLGSAPADFVPGSSARYMSFSPVFGRSSTCALRYTGAYFFCMLTDTTATPLRSVTLCTSPTFTPAMSIVCPWPGTTAWPVCSSTFSL